MLFTILISSKKCLINLIFAVTKSFPEAYILATFNRQKEGGTNFEYMKEDTFKSDDKHDFKIAGLSTTHGRA